jgi:flagellar motor protein MotB
MRTRRKLPLFNQWPPFVDAMVLVFAAFFFIALIALAKQQRLLGALEAKNQELERIKADKSRIERRLVAIAKAAGAPGMANVEVEDGKVILQGEVLFDSGSDELKPEGAQFLASLAGPLKQVLDAEPDQMVMIAGHTDDLPLRPTARFSTNWELSAARAVSVAKELARAVVPLPEAKVMAAGFGPYHPRVANKDEASRRQNRRIEVLLVPLRAVTNE